MDAEDPGLHLDENSSKNIQTQRGGTGVTVSMNNGMFTNRQNQQSNMNPLIDNSVNIRIADAEMPNDIALFDPEQL